MEKQLKSCFYANKAKMQPVSLCTSAKEKQVDFLKHYRDEDATSGRTGLSFSQVWRGSGLSVG